MDFRLPSINGQTSQEQIGQMKSYIYQLVEQLNFAFSSLENSNYEIVDTIVKANGNEGKSTDRQSKFNQLKDLIIKTAAIVNAYEEVWIKEFKGSYTADSDFGKYSRQTLNQITANSTNITAAFTKLSKITNPDGTGILDNIEAYIKAGELDTDIYGVEIGETNNGSFTHFARFTASRLSFYDGNGSEVAYVSNNKIFINKAQFNDVVSIGNDSGGELNVYNGKINVYVGTGNNQRKVLYADNDGNLVLSGTINAQKGQIAGFNIDGDTLYGAQVGMDAVSGGDYAFWAGAAKGNSANAPFKVGHDGSLYATSGQIGGWKIASDRIYNKSSATGYTFSLWNPSVAGGTIISCNNGNDYPFYVNRDGSLHATSAYIKGTLQAGSIISNDVGIGNYKNTKFTDYGTTTTAPPYFLGTKWYSSDDNNQFIALSNYGITVGATGANGFLTLQNTGDNSSGLMHVYKSSANKDHFCMDGAHYIDLTINGEAKLTCASSGGNLKGTSWNYNGVEIKTTGSDIRIKHNINLLNEKYSSFFDKLKPISFIYKENAYGYGTSQRTHIGFIANEIETALLNSELTNQDFAGLVIQERGTEQELYTLRYEEFIALNTWQIQKAKARITELENTVAELTTKMTELESRLSAIESTLN